jgi:hypothetical protein
LKQANFIQLYEIIYNKFISISAETKWIASNIGFSKFLGHSHNGKVQAWSKGQWPNAYDCWVIHQKLGFRLEWLLTGEGEMFHSEDQQPDAPSAIAAAPTAQPFIITPAVPVLGLAACGVEGLEQIMPYHLTASPIALSPRAFAVLASGESMAPAGIASGHLCFCDPDQPVLPNEAVFLRQKNNLGALKLFLGRGERGGYTRFQGWLAARDGHGNQKQFLVEVLNEEIDCIAPVICIRRRG